ncbi:DNA ligase [Paenibacillus thalictri]|uniref:DNA ligase n=1 Tax=Paenibacillus thalictri TaxID=2527873 RepID=A0A4Q9DVR9_9BACL|nr:DNA ligase [Paenibacillus thalictri]TBL81119.1 DNA ligase [Paenibacillus thalictri]
MLFTAIKPMTASKGKEAFDDEQFLFEPMYGGVRLLLHKKGGRIEAYTRSGSIVTFKFPELKEAAAQMTAESAIVDCEGIVLRDGKPAFDDTLYRLRISQAAKIAGARMTHPATFVAMDVLYMDGPVLEEPLTMRKQRLNELIAPSQTIAQTMFVQGQGKALFDLTGQMGLKGVVAKRKDSPYLPGARSEDWIGITHPRTIDAVILGYTTNPLALRIGLHFRTVANKPVGVVKDGIKPQEAAAFLKTAVRLHTFSNHGTQWIEPCLCCRIQYLDSSELHQLQDITFLGFLPEKRPEDCMWSY